MAGRKRLSAAEWTEAACAALADGGLAAVAVEPIAARLGTTKGSFYWHFTDRDALVAAALERWEHDDTEEVIALVEAEPDVRARLRTLLRVAIGEAGAPPGRSTVELALQPSARHPLVEPVLARVTRRRLAYLADLFAALGLAGDEAERRSLLAYTAYLGHAQLAHATPGIAPTADDLTRYVDGVIEMLTRR